MANLNLSKNEARAIEALAKEIIEIKNRTYLYDEGIVCGCCGEEIDIDPETGECKSCLIDQAKKKFSEPDFEFEKIDFEDKRVQVTYPDEKGGHIITVKALKEKWENEGEDDGFIAFFFHDLKFKGFAFTRFGKYTLIDN